MSGHENPHPVNGFVNLMPHSATNRPPFEKICIRFDD